MSEGKHITLAELFERDAAKRKADFEAQQAWEATPEGSAWRAAEDAYHARMRAADERFAVEHPDLDNDENNDNDDDENE